MVSRGKRETSLEESPNENSQRSASTLLPVKNQEAEGPEVKRVGAAGLPNKGASGRPWMAIATAENRKTTVTLTTRLAKCAVYSEGRSTAPSETVDQTCRAATKKAGALRPVRRQSSGLPKTKAERLPQAGGAVVLKT